MRKSSFNQSLPTVEGSLSSQDTSNNSRGSRNSSHRNSSNPSLGLGGPHKSGMKRSPYLSAMTTNSSGEDLVALLSRPSATTGGGGDGMRGAGVGGSGAGGGQGSGRKAGGGMDFFNLKRPSSSGWNNQQQGQGRGGGLGGGAGVGIPPVSSKGTTNTTDDQHNMSGETVEGDFNQPSSSGITPPPASAAASAARMPSLRSALRVNSNAQLQSSREGTTAISTTTNNANNSGMKKNASVTFSTNTKNPSQLGLQQGSSSPAATITATGNNDAFPLFGNPNKDYSAGGMMRKSQSICAPEYLLARSVGGGSSSNSGGGGGTPSLGGGSSISGASSTTTSGGGSGDGNSDGVGNASFPIYFAKLGSDEGSGGQSSQASQQQQQLQQQQHQPSSLDQGGHNNIRRKSKSMNTLQYSYQNDELLHSSSSNNPHTTSTNTTAAANNNNNNPNTNDATIKLFGALGINPTSRAFFKFRDMLDEGDGNEGDLNLRLRNQQWKDFRMFSKEFESENPMLLGAIDEDRATTTSSSSMDRDDAVAATAATPMATGGTSSSLSGSKRAISPSSSNQQSSSMPSKTTTAAAFMNSFGSHRQLNSHRASVSVNDLAMLRRSAARMRVVNNSPHSNTASSLNFTTSNRNFTTSSPGATLGGEMLSRLSSKDSLCTSISSKGSGSGGGAAAAVAAVEASLSPLAQMMAKSANLSSKQQQDLLLSKVIYQMNTNVNDSSSSPSSGLPQSQMGRRVHTVGAGLAYGGPNLSRFDLGSIRKDMSIMSGGSGSSSGKNEEWDL